METKKIFLLENLDMRFGLIQEFFSPFYNIEWAQTFTEGVNAFADKSRDYYSFVLLDHDLDDPNGTGEDFVRMFKSKLNRKQTVIISMNLAGGREMKKLIPNALHIPFNEFVTTMVQIVKDRQLFQEIL